MTSEDNMADKIKPPLTSKKRDVIVIGGGISGLSAARILERDGLDVLVLEARDRVGGRTWTVRDPAYGYTDVGGAYVGPTQRRVARLANELGLELHNVNVKERTLIRTKDMVTSYKGSIPTSWRLFAMLDLNATYRNMDKLSKQVPKEAPWLAPRAEEWDSMTFADYLNKTCWTNFSRHMGTVLVKAIMAMEPHEVSFLFVLWYIHSGNGVVRLSTIHHGAQERKFVGGASRLSERMTEDLGERVVLEQPVIRVVQTESGVTVTTSNGDVYEADYVISAMPLTILNRVTFVPPLPPKRAQLIQRVPMGSIIKTITFYEKAFWKERDFSGEIISDQSPIWYCMDDTKPDGSHPALMGFILANEARQLQHLSKEQRGELVAKNYARLLRDDRLLKPVHYVEQNWSEEEYSGGCYVMTMPPGVLTQLGPEIKKPFDRVHFAGTECATMWIGYMDGAIQAGERAAREIMHLKGLISKGEVDQHEPLAENFPDTPVDQLVIEQYLPSISQLLWGCGAAGALLLAWCTNKYINNIQIIYK